MCSVEPGRLILSNYTSSCNPPEDTASGSYMQVLNYSLPIDCNTSGRGGDKLEDLNAKDCSVHMPASAESLHIRVMNSCRDK